MTCFDVTAEAQGTRLISRISADASGATAHIALLAFRVIDSIMACRQLIGLRNRIEYCEEGHPSPRDPETGGRDEYQYYEILYAGGDRAGVAGKESGAKWRQAAIRDGVLDEREGEPGIDEHHLKVSTVLVLGLDGQPPQAGVVDDGVGDVDDAEGEEQAPLQDGSSQAHARLPRAAAQAGDLVLITQAGPLRFHLVLSDLLTSGLSRRAH